MASILRPTLVLLLFMGLGVSARAEAPVSLALVIDRSGSLSAKELAATRELARSVFASLPEGSEAAVFTFDDQSRLVQPLVSSAGAIQKALAEVKTSGRFTALHDALYDSSRYLRDAGHGRRAILLVTDGKDENSALVLEDGLRVAQDTGIPIVTVGVGRVEERVLRRIAKLTSGQYVAMAEARGPALAALLVESGSPAAASPPAASPAPATPAPGARTSSQATSPPPARRSRALWAALLLAVAVVAGVTALRLRGRGRARCARCGRELPSALSRCVCCPTSSADPGLTASASPVSETVVARMNITEEFLEKTMTLRERPVLVVTHGSKTGEVVRLSPDTTTSVGRARANDIVVDDLAVSSEHCRIRPEQGRFVLHDLKSTNGTFVNERRVTRHPLAEGDVVKVGETTLQFRMERRHD